MKDEMRTLRDAKLFAARLREFRLRRGWTQSQLAQKVGARQEKISRLETRERSPSIEDLVRLTHALEVSFDELVCVSRSCDSSSGRGSDS